jgi:hypothetical protein
MLPDDLDSGKVAAAVANIIETKGRLDTSGKPVSADLAEKDPAAFRNSERYRMLMAAGGDIEHEEPSVMAAFAQMIEQAVTKGNAKK